DPLEMVTLGLLPRLVSARLASLAASICSRVLTSGSDSLTFFLARDTWRFVAFRVFCLYSTLHPRHYCRAYLLEGWFRVSAAYSLARVSTHLRTTATS